MLNPVDFDMLVNFSSISVPFVCSSLEELRKVLVLLNDPHVAAINRSTQINALKMKLRDAAAPTCRKAVG